MRVPESLAPLIEQGTIDSVVRPLMSGKEAAVYLVLARGRPCAAKVYNEANNRSFKHRADYTEGRRVRNTRDMRAMAKRSRFGRQQLEASWRNTVVDVIYKLQAAGVRVPEPYDYVDGVLVMELVVDDTGEPAPRLVDVTLEPEQGMAVFEHLIREVQRMLCAGVVHGDLSDFNVLMTAEGPVIIDFPQAVDPAHNRNARKLLIRDVRNLTSFLARHTPKLKGTRYAEEMWQLYEAGKLTPDTKLTGKWKPPSRKADTSSLLAEIEALEREARERRERLGLAPARPARAPVVFEPEPAPAQADGAPPSKKKRRRRRKKKPAGEGSPVAAQAPRPEPEAASDAPPKRRRRRRRRRRPSGGSDAPAPSRDA
jgi:RIO kinase 1